MAVEGPYHRPSRVMLAQSTLASSAHLRKDGAQRRENGFDPFRVWVRATSAWNRQNVRTMQQVQHFLRRGSSIGVLTIQSSERNSSRDSWAALVEEGKDRFKQKEWGAALENWNEALTVQLTSPNECTGEEISETLNLIGIALGQLGDTHQFSAFHAFEKALAVRTETMGPGEEETAEVVHNMWVLLHNASERHRSRQVPTVRNQQRPTEMNEAQRSRADSCFRGLSSPSSSLRAKEGAGTNAREVQSCFELLQRAAPDDD